MRPRFYAITLLFCVITAIAHAAPREEVEEQVVSVAPDLTLTLATQGATQLADLAFPDLTLAKAWLEAHAVGKLLPLTVLGPDRYGRVLVTGDITESMLRDGAALLFAQGRAKKALLEAEEEARLAKRGLWANLPILTPDAAADHLWQFQLVEGVVTRIYDGKSATYLNFGEDWHTDFSVMIPGRNRRSFEKLLDGISSGTRVRVRGTIFPENGPMLRLTRPEQLEIL